MRSRNIILFVFFSLLVGGCSADKNTLVSKTYHNLTSHYNAYFYALEEITKVESAYLKTISDDYNRVLRLYPKLDSAQSKNYEKEIDETVKMASLAIQRHKNSKWVDDSYVLIGKARLYSLDWGNAIQTFKFVNTKSKNNNTRHKATLNLMRTYIEHEEYTNARSAAEYLEKEKLSAENQKKLYMEKAYLAQEQNDWDGMVRNLTAAVPFLKKPDRPGRTYFIIGQVYQRLGFEAAAYSYYKKCLSTNPEYEIDFYARLYMAQVTELSKSKDINTARKSFKKLLKDSKNREFKDKIYYEMGMFENKQKNTEQAIDLFNQAINIGTNKQVDGEAYLRLGEIYYNTRKYELSQAYYDSAVSTLPANYENLEAIKKRHAILDDFVKHINTIRWQDSLLTMAAMDTAHLRTYLDSVIRKKNQQPVVQKKRKNNRIELEQNPSVIFPTNMESVEGSTWYFANPSAVSLGQSEFVRVWGTLMLEDNWRRSQRSVSRTQQTVNTTPAIQPDTQVSAAVEDPVKAAFSKLMNELPNTEEKKKKAKKNIEDAYYNLGDIYSLQLNEPSNAVETYETLLHRFPLSDYEAEVLYRIYILTKENSPPKAQQAAYTLKEKYPNSSWAKLLANPNYLAEAGKTVVRQKRMYADAYTAYISNNFDSARFIIHQALSLDSTRFSPNLILLNILIDGKTKSIEIYQTNLQKFIAHYPEHELNAFAKNLLEVSKRSPSTSLQENNIFSNNIASPHIYVIAYKTDAPLEKLILESLQKFHARYFSEQLFSVSPDLLSVDQAFCSVGEFSDEASAIEYITLFNEKLSTMGTLKNYNFNNFVITKDNLAVLKRTQALKEYISFYTNHYKTP